MGLRSQNRSHDKIVEGVKSADIDDKMKIFEEALKVAYEHGNAENSSAMSCTMLPPMLSKLLREKQ
jgi:hypothetical protein